jgi:hypothetical protein
MRKGIVFIIIFLSLSGCGIFKRSVVTRTEIITKVDTVVKVQIQRDTVFVTSALTDTAKIESVTGTSIAYIDPIKAKIVLSFLPKTFDVPIILNRKVKEVVKTKEPMTKLILKFFIIMFSFICFFLFFLIWYIDRKIKMFLPKI